ncbi:hypothetical protein DMENIID0001_157400 [Sergentomyia squamirostris]
MERRFPGKRVSKGEDIVLSGFDTNNVEGKINVLFGESSCKAETLAITHIPEKPLIQGERPRAASSRIALTAHTHTQVGVGENVLMKGEPLEGCDKERFSPKSFPLEDIQ